MNYLPAVAVIGLHRGSLIKIGKPKGIWASCVTRTGSAGRTRPVTRNGTPAQADNRFAANNSTINPGTDSHDAFHTALTFVYLCRFNTPLTSPPAFRQGPLRPAHRDKCVSSCEGHGRDAAARPATGRAAPLLYTRCVRLRSVPAEACLLRSLPRSLQHFPGLPKAASTSRSSPRIN